MERPVGTQRGLVKNILRRTQAEMGARRNHSVHDGDKWMHEPLRLSVFIEAPTTAIDAILIKHDNVRELLDNGWLHLVSIEDDGQTMRRYCGDGEWARVVD